MLPRSSFFILSSSLLLLLAACEDTLQNSLPATGDGLPVTLTLDSREESAATRTTLGSADPTHHVQQVEILIFEGGGDDAQCIDTETIKTWPKEQNSLTYTLQHPFVEGQTYTLLGVGKDTEFNSTYDIDENKTLGETYAKLKDGKSKDDIAQCEFFTGTVTFTHQGRGTQIDDLTMRRRVAGVMLYVTEIPQEVEGKRVTSVRLELGSNQKSSVLLKRDFTDLEWTEPDGQEELTGSQTLAQIDLSNYTYTEGQDFYMEKGKPAIGYAGVYMLPLNKTENVNTFTVKLYGKEVNGEGNLTGTEELVKSFTVTNHNANSTTFDIRSNYIYCIGKKGEGIDEPISLSGKPIYLDVTEWTTISTNNPTFESARVQALFDDTDNPIHNCMNEEITIKILPPLETIKQYVTKIKLDILPNTYALNDNGETTLIHEDNGLSENAKNYYSNWLYVKQSNNTYTKEYILYDGTGNIDGMTTNLTLFLRDYARFRSWGWAEPNSLQDNQYSWVGTKEDIERINRDFRYTDILLTTHIEWDKNNNNIIEENEKSDRTDTLRIHQYNTITVNYRNMGDNSLKQHIVTCGFSRQDLTQNAWGYQDSNNGVVYTTGLQVPFRSGHLSNGSLNVTQVGKNNNLESYIGSAIGIAARPIKYINADGTLIQSFNYTVTDKDQRVEKCWYLPAQLELQGFLIQCASNVEGESIKSNILFDNIYWTSTLRDQAGKDAISFKETTTGPYIEYVDRDNTNNRYHIRQARRFPDETGYDYQW